MAGARGSGRLDVFTLGVLLVPAFALLCANRAGIIGLYNDDAMYAVAARLLAEGADPTRADLTHWAPLSRFPIGFPALLAPLWIAGGRGLGAVPLWEMAVIAATLVFLVASYLALTRLWAVNRWCAGAAVLLVAYHPYTIKYGPAVMSDLPFAGLAIGCLALVEWVRRREAGRCPGGADLPAGRVLPPVLAGLAFGLTALVRYAAAAPLAAAILVLLLERRAKETAIMLAAAGAVLAPWIWCVWSHGLSGYATQYFDHARKLPLGQSLRDAAWMLGTQALPGFFAPSALLTGLVDGGGPRVSAASPVALIAACVAAWLLGTCCVQVPRTDRRLPALYALATCGMILVWAGRFPDLAWDLEVRLLLPVAPIVLAFAFEAALREIRPLAGWRKVAVGCAAAAGIGLAARDFADVNRTQFDQKGSLVDPHLGGLLAARGYLQRLPAEVKVGAIYPFQVYFYMDRPIFAVECSLAGLLAARDRGIRVIVATPRWRDRRDQMYETVMDLARRQPPLAKILYAASPVLAVVHLPADPAHPPATR